METTPDTAPSGGAPTDIVQVPAAGSEPLSPREAARTLAGFRAKQREIEPEPKQPREVPPFPSESEVVSGAEDAAAAEAGEGAGPRQESSVEPPLAPPSSWSKEARERWSTLDRPTQDFLLAREGESEAAQRRAQDETQAQRAAAEDERRRLLEARQQYEAALPNLLTSLLQQQGQDFSDIKSLPDAERLAREDWPRYVLWDAQQKRISALQGELKTATERQEREHSLGHEARVKRELELFIEKAPEIADPAQRAKLQDAAVVMLRELGFAEPELKEMWAGRKDISLHDHRLHLLIRDGLVLGGALPLGDAGAQVQPVKKLAILADASEAETRAGLVAKAVSISFGVLAF
jgi:hypothetical protein